MAAFQQRRRDTGLAPIYSVPSQDNLAAQATLSDDAEVLLFGPPSPPQSSSSVLADSTWTILPAPYSRATRSISYTSSQSSASWQSRTSADAATSLGSPASLNHSLLPSHNGTGVFAPSSSLVQSQVLPSLYASAVDFDSASETGDSASDLPSGASARLRRPSLAPSDHSNLSFDSDFSSSSSINASWALTEAALSTVPSARRRGRHALPGTDVLGTSQVLPQEDEVQDEDDKSSAGFTSDSSVEEEHVADEGASAARRTGRRKSRRGRRWATTAQASPAQRAAEQDEVDLALSHAAMSAGIVSSRRRAGPRPAQPQPSPAVESSSSAIRSLSPFRTVESARSRRSVGSSGQRYKRRHRQAGRAGSSQKRSSTSASAGLSFASMEAERQRAQRMKKLVFERAQEEQIRTAQKSVLFGSLASKVMAIDPSTFPLLASAPTESAYPTPTPSRSTSPRPGGSRFPSARGAAVFARQARSELSLSGFDLLGETRQSTTFEDDDEGALTETEMDQPSTVWHRSASPPALAPRHYTSPAPISPPVRSLSSPSLPAYFHLSPLVSPSNNALDIVLDELPARPLARRRSSSYISSPSAAPLNLAVSAPLPSSPAARSNPLDLSHLSHEERILLSPSSPSSSVAGSAWGGDLDSFELAMSYWRRFLRKLKGGTAPHGAGIDEPEGMGRREEEATTPLVERVLVPAIKDDGPLIPGKYNEPWFGIIVYFLEGSTTGTLDVHVQWLSHSRTLNGRFAHARHLVLREMCDTMEASKIVRKLDIVKCKEAGAPSSSFFYTSTFSELDKSFSSLLINNAAVRCEAAGLRDCSNCEETLTFYSDHCKDAEGNAEPVPHWVKSPSSIHYTSSTYHLLDYVYLLPHQKSKAHWNGAQPFFRLGRLLNIELPSHFKKLDRNTKITIQPLIRLGNLRLLDGHDEHNIVVLDEKVNVKLEELCGGWVLKQGEVPSQQAPYEEVDTFWTSLKLTSRSSSIRAIRTSFFRRAPPAWRKGKRSALDDTATAPLLKKNGSHPLRAVPLYSGIDLFGWGLEQGCPWLKVTMAVESDDEVAAILQLNRPNVDLRRTTVAAQVEAAYHEYKSGKTLFNPIDVVVAGPPCQPFSHANRKPDKHDPRLLEVFVALSFVSLADPLLSLFENVQRLAWFSYNDEQGDFLGLFRDLAVILGYQIRPAILDAASYGSPQHRRRLFCQLAKDGLPLPQTPPPSHSVSTERLGGSTDDGGATAYATATERALVQSSPHPPMTVDSVLGGLDAFEAKAGEISGFIQDSHGELDQLVPAFYSTTIKRIHGIGSHLDGQFGDWRGVPATYRLLAYNGGPTTSAQVYVAALQFFLERLADANIDSARGFKVVGNGVAVPTASAIGREWSNMPNPIISTVSGHLDDGQSAFDYLKDQLKQGRRFDSPAAEVEAIDEPDHLLELVLANQRSASPSISELSLEEEELDVGEEGSHSEVEADLGIEEKSSEAEEDDEEDEIHIL
ncbi:hypothetical protein JCM1841_004548 [Sporobolomyces salmonicolor]